MTSDRYERNLASVGLGFGDIDFVMCTPCTSYVWPGTRGWRMGTGWKAAGGALHVFADRELAFWTDKERNDPGKQPWIVDSVLPIVEANRHEIVKSDHRLSDTVLLLPTPGHTIDHYSVRIGKPGADAVIGGDMIHSPLQARYPELCMRADYDRAQGGVSRRTLFGQISDTSTLLCTGHFPSPSVGRLTGWGDGFRYNPVS